MARSLIAAGVEPGDRVALWAPNSVHWVTASFGVSMSGAALVPLNTRFKSDEAAYVVRSAGARVLLTVRDFLGEDFVAIAEAWDDVPSLERVVDIGGEKAWTTWLTEGDTVAPAEVEGRERGLDGGSVSDIIFTSGTTGAPKGAVLTHGASVRTYEAWSDAVGLREGDRYLVVYPFFHTAGLKSGILACVLRGAEIHPFPVFDVDAVMDYVARHRITMLPGPPTVFQSILDHPRFGEFDLSSLRLSVTGAAVVPVEVVRRMREDLRFETVVTGYGLTETTGTVSMCRHDDPPETVATTVGRPLTGVEVKVVSDEGQTLPPGAPGEILVRGFNVMKEYFADPDRDGTRGRRRRLAAHRRHRFRGRRRQPADHRPQEGHVHLRRVQRLPRRGGGDDAAPSRGGPSGGRRDPGRSAWARWAMRSWCPGPASSGTPTRSSAGAANPWPTTRSRAPSAPSTSCPSTRAARS